MSRHHGQCHVTMVNVTPSLSMSRHHGQCHAIIVNVTPPWSMSRHHGQCHATLVNVTPPWSMSGHHGQCHATLVNVTPPRSMSGHHGQCHATMVNSMIYFVHKKNSEKEFWSHSNANMFRVNIQRLYEFSLIYIFQRGHTTFRHKCLCVFI